MSHGTKCLTVCLGSALSANVATITSGGADVDYVRDPPRFAFDSPAMCNGPDGSIAHCECNCVHYRRGGAGGGESAYIVSSGAPERRSSTMSAIVFRQQNCTKHVRPGVGDHAPCASIARGRRDRPDRPSRDRALWRCLKLPVAVSASALLRLLNRRQHTQSLPAAITSEPAGHPSRAMI